MKLMKILFPICLAVWGIAGATAAAGPNPGLRSEVILPVLRNGNAGALPPSVDNGRLKYLRPVFNHLGHACGFAAGIAYAFTYEMDAMRDLDAQSADNQYSYLYPYHFFNDGTDSAWNDDFTLAFDLAMTNGIPNCTDQGGFENGFPTKWVNGYDNYFRGMHNRISDYFAVDLLAADGLDKMKRWIYDHSDGSKQGGVLNFAILCLGIQNSTVPLGTPMGGASIVTLFGYSHPHAMTIVGYNDSVRFDMNNDRKYTNNLDINGDGKINLRDWEIGAVKIVNSWGLSYGDSGFAYAPYCLLATPGDSGGISRENKVFGMNVIKSYTPKLAIRATVTHTSRNKIKITAGVSENPEATAPDKVKTFGGLFNFAGGAYPMEGKGRSATIEFGLDVTELLDSIRGNTGKFFLIIESKEAGGTVDSIALMDYTTHAFRTISSDRKAVPIAPNSTLNLGIVGTVSPVKRNGAPVRQCSPFSAFPNPIPSRGKVRFALPPSVADNAVLSIATTAGKVVFQAKYDKSDFHRIEWDLKRHSPLPVPRGVYYARLSLRTLNVGIREYSTVLYVR